MVASSIQNLPAFVDSGQHSIVTAPADTGPSPRMRNLTLRGSGSTSFLPAPVVALSCNGLRTLMIVARSFIGIFDRTGKVAAGTFANRAPQDGRRGHPRLSHCAPKKYYWEIIADNLSKAGWSWAASQR